ncbi:MAG: TetR/AcrR family transcriptional regulator [Actinomycetota bacterium]|nr:TetR/AcrR family transcriptional regulator [Actinomycetota bacterium]
MHSSSPPSRARYHHGDLRNALIDAAVAGVRLNGPDAVVLRNVARQVGVSHNAGYRHFASRDDLLAAVAARGLAELAQAMEIALAAVAPGSDPAVVARGRLRAVGRAYVTYAMSESGMFRTMWAGAGDPSAPPEPEARGASGLGAYQLLNEALDDLVRVGALPASRRRYSEIAAWSAVHGLASLVIDGPLDHLPAAAIDGALDRLCDVVDAGL